MGKNSKSVRMSKWNKEESGTVSWLATMKVRFSVHEKD
jgi:hypothetical protein